MGLFDPRCLRLSRWMHMGAKEIKHTRKDLKLTVARYGSLLQVAKVTDLVYMTRHHSYPATHRTIRGYTGAGLMAFTAHVHPKAPQDDKVFLYGVKSGKKWGSGGGAGLFKGLFKGGRAGLVKGGGAVVYHSRSWKKIDMSRLVRDLNLRPRNPSLSPGSSTKVPLEDDTLDLMSPSAPSELVVQEDHSVHDGIQAENERREAELQALHEGERELESRLAAATEALAELI